MGTNLSVTLFPVYQAEYHMSSAEITLLFAVYAVFLLPILLIFGSLSDQIGRKPVLIPSMLLMLLATLIFAWSSNTIELFAGRILQGISTGAFLGTGTAFMVDHAGEKRASTLRLVSLTTMIGFGLGPAVSGLLLQYSAWRHEQMPYLLYSGLMVIAIAGALTVTESVRKADSLQWRIRVGVPRPLRQPFFRFIGPAGLVFFALNGTAMALIPSFSIQVLHTHNDALNGGFIFLMMVAGGIAQWFTPNRGLIRMTRIGLLLTVMGMFLIILSGVWTNLVFMLLSVVVQGVGSGLVFKGSLGLAGKLGEGPAQAQVVSSYYVAAYIGLSIPVFFTGILINHFGMVDGILILATVFGLWVGWILMDRKATSALLIGDGGASRSPDSDHLIESSR